MCRVTGRQNFVTRRCPPQRPNGLIRRIGYAMAVFSALSQAVPAAADDRTVLVFAAASLADAMTAVAQLYTSETGRKVSLVFAASSALARQIENGAPAEIFVSANSLWMDRLDSAGLIARQTRSDIAGNRLALIAPLESGVVADIGPSLDIPALLGGGRLAMGDPDHVPAGMYGRAALESLGLWGEAEPRLARASDTRGALALVARGETPLGIVYATDAAITGKVRLVGLFPTDSHPSIVYPAALTIGAGEAARDFLAFLSGPEAGAIFRERGFAGPTGGDFDPAS